MDRGGHASQDEHILYPIDMTTTLGAAEKSLPNYVLLLINLSNSNAHTHTHTHTHSTGVFQCLHFGVFIIFCSCMSDTESWMELADLYVQVNE